MKSSRATENSTQSDNMMQSEALMQHCIGAMEKAGADACDVVLHSGTDMTYGQRLGKPETVERSQSAQIELRALVAAEDGYRQAIVSSDDLRHETVNMLIERVVEMAKVVPADPHTGLADSKLLVQPQDRKDLSLCDEYVPEIDQLKAWAAEAEDSALAIKGVTNSDGANAGFEQGRVWLATSAGFSGQHDYTTFSVSASVVAGSAGQMETDYDFSYARHCEDLRSPAEIGKIAGERAVNRLHPKRMPTGKLPVIFDARVARSLLGAFSGAINGAAIARGTSFLKDAMGQGVFSSDINVMDDPLRVRGLASEPFDAEGVAGKKMALVKDGVLQTWLLDTRTANQLGLTTTGHASRGSGGAPHPSSSNLYMEAGSVSVKELIADIKQGFFVTDVFGMGVNGVTGDYSQGAAGFWIDSGEIVFPVSEMTIAGNLKEMFRQLTPADDLVFHYGTNCPTVRIEGMTVAGL